MAEISRLISENNRWAGRTRVAKIGFQKFEEGDGELPAGQGQQKSVFHVLREQERPLLRAGWAEVKCLITERTETAVDAGLIVFVLIDDALKILFDLRIGEQLL